MSKHFQPYESPDAGSPAANSHMPPYPGRIATPQAPPPPRGDRGGSADRIKWIALASFMVIAVAVIGLAFLMTYVSRQAASRKTITSTEQAKDGERSSLFDDVRADGDRTADSGDDPLRAFDLGDSPESSDDHASDDASSTHADHDKAAGRDDILGGTTVRTDVRFNADAKPAPRALGPVPGARTTPSTVPIIKESEDNPKVALNIYQPGIGIPLKRRETTPPPPPPPVVAPAPVMVPRQNPDTIRSGNGVLALPRGYSATTQPQMQHPMGNAQPAPMQRQPMPQYQQQPAPMQRQPMSQYQQQPAPMQRQPMPQYQQQPMSMPQQQQLPPAAQLDPYRNAAGSPTQASPPPQAPRQPATAMVRPSASSAFGRGLAAQQSGDYERAIEQYKLALEANPSHFGAFNNLGVVYRQQGDYDKAVQVLSEALALHPQDVRVANNLAGCFIKRRQYPQAERVLRQALAAAPNDLAALTNLGIIYTAMGNLRDAEYYLNNAVQMHPQEPRAYYNLGNLYRRMGRSEPAMRNYLRFLEMSGGRHPQQEAQVRQMLGNTGGWRR